MSAGERSSSVGPDRAPRGKIAPMTAPIRQRVGCRVEVDVQEPALLAFQVAVADGPTTTHHLELTLDGQPLDAERLQVLPGEHGGHLHQLICEPGHLQLAYQAEVTSPLGSPGSPGSPGELLTYLRPSRYCPSDRLTGWAASELEREEGFALVQSITTWINERLDYVLGSSGPTDDATDTLLAGQGVCRDFAHLGVALCRALDVPARLVAVYAPGLSPMDFHAVFEAHVEGAWHLFDATGLAPRASMVRIATGRDAADTAFLSSYRGVLELQAVEVTAVVQGELPVDDPHAPATLA